MKSTTDRREMTAVEMVSRLLDIAEMVKPLDIEAYRKVMGLIADVVMCEAEAERM